MSGKFLNDLGDYEGCQTTKDSKYMLGKYTIKSTYNNEHIGNSFNSYVIGVCVPKECSSSDNVTMTNYYTNLSRDFLTEHYFDYTQSKENIVLNFHDVEVDAHTKSTETESTSSVMIVVVIFLFLLSIMGLIVEKTNLANRPNLKEEEEEEDKDFWQNMFDDNPIADRKNLTKDEEYEKFKEEESKLIMSKTLWGILLLSFSFSRNAKRLFQFSVIRRKNVKTSSIEGTKVFFLFWIMIGNTFLYSFYSFPANFDKKKDIGKNFWFITLFNNEFAFDTWLFFIAFILGNEFLEKFDQKVFSTCTYILHVIHFIIKMLLPVVIIIGISAVFPLFSGGPMWSVMTEGITGTCDKYLWTHAVFISNLYPFENSVGQK